MGRGVVELIQYIFAAIGILALIRLAWTWPRGAKRDPAVAYVRVVYDDPNGNVVDHVGAIACTRNAAWVNVDGKSKWKCVERDE